MAKTGMHEKGIGPPVFTSTNEKQQSSCEQRDKVLHWRADLPDPDAVMHVRHARTSADVRVGADAETRAHPGSQDAERSGHLYWQVCST